jgi:pyruvate/2-oxoglutarate dehydrogenase complex dihydrolipoamide dehydrogenase (E3) component
MTSVEQRADEVMSQVEHFDVLVLGSGQGGQLIAWHLAQAGRRAALVERRWIGGSCPTIACMPSKTEVWRGWRTSRNTARSSA